MDRFLAYMATLCNVTKCNIPKNKLIWQVKYKKNGLGMSEKYKLNKVTATILISDRQTLGQKHCNAKATRSIKI